MWGRQERRKTGRRRQETEEGGKYYQMRRWKSCGQHLTPDKGKRGRERSWVWTAFLVAPFWRWWRWRSVIGRRLCFCSFFAYKKILGRTETRTRERKYLGRIRSVWDISRGDRAIIATCSLRTSTDRLKEKYSIDCWSWSDCYPPNAVTLPQSMVWWDMIGMQEPVGGDRERRVPAAWIWCAGEWITRVVQTGLVKCAPVCGFLLSTVQQSSARPAVCGEGLLVCRTQRSISKVQARNDEAVDYYLACRGS